MALAKHMALPIISWSCDVLIRGFPVRQTVQVILLRSGYSTESHKCFFNYITVIKSGFKFSVKREYLIRKNLKDFKMSKKFHFDGLHKNITRGYLNARRVRARRLKSNMICLAIFFR